MPLKRLTPDMMKAVEETWRDQCQAFNEDFEEFAPESMKHAIKICNEPVLDPRYGIYGVFTENVADAIVHVNRASLPGSTGYTLRFVWVLLAPRFDFEDLTIEQFASVTSELINGAKEIAEQDSDVEHLKIHLGNFIDRQYFSDIAVKLSSTKHFLDCRLRGNWFHLSFNRSNHF